MEAQTQTAGAPLGVQEVNSTLTGAPVATETGKNKPVKKFRAGALSVTIWDNTTTSKDGLPRSYKTLNIERGYQDKQGVWKKAKSLRISDIPKVVALLSKAYDYLILKEEE